MFSAIKRWTGSRAVEDDLRAISGAMALCAFLWLLKIHLACWYVFSQHSNPFDEISTLQVLLLGGGDLIVCTTIAAIYFLLYRSAHLLPRWGSIAVAGVIPVALHVAVAIFSVVSWQVNQVYGIPLEIMHIRAAANLGTVWSSIAAYLRLVPILYMALGVLSFPLLGWLFRRITRPMGWLLVRWRLWAVLMTATVVLGGLWAVRLRSIYAFGLKKNALIHFWQYYRPLPKPVDIAQMLRSESAAMKGREDELQPAASVYMPGKMEPRDFPAPPKADEFNVVLIIIESTASSYVDRQATPSLMRLADTGLRFMNHATTCCTTSRAVYSLLYSDYLMEMGVRPRSLYGNRPMPQQSLTQVLKGAGYQTAFFHSGFLDYADIEFLVSDFDTRIGAASMQSTGKKWTWGVYEETAVEVMAQWIKANKGRKFFLTYSTIFPHHPYVTTLQTKPFPQDTWYNRYRNSLYYTDQNIGRLIDLIEQENLRDNTLIVAVADHGETVLTYPVGHGLAMTLEEFRVPLIISNPKLFKQKQESRLSTSHLDIAPTLTAMLGLQPSADWLGRNLLADQIPARMLFVNMNLANINGIIDNGVAYDMDEKNGRATMYEMVEGRMSRLKVDDPRNTLIHAYQSKLALAKHWMVWRHLARAASR